MKLISGAKRAADMRGRGRTAFYDDIRRGLMTAPVPNGARAVVWPLVEIEEINRARVAGLGDDEIRKLVDRMHAARALGAGGAAGECVAKQPAAAKAKRSRTIANGSQVA